MELRDKIDNKEISLADFVCLEGGRSWVRMIDHGDFQDWLPQKPLSIPGFAFEPSEENDEKLEIDRRLDAFKKKPTRDYIRVFERADYSANAVFEVNGEKFSGECTTIGQGGCFITCNPKNLHKELVAKLMITPGLVPIKIDCSGEISSIIVKRPTGVGFKFLDIQKSTTESIQIYVEQFLKSLRR